jgi:hypothetical protein
LPIAAALTDPSPAKQSCTMKTASLAPLIADPVTIGAQCGSPSLLGYVVRPISDQPAESWRQTANSAVPLLVQVAASAPFGVRAGIDANGMPEMRLSSLITGPCGGWYG